MKILYLTESMGWSGGAAQALRMAIALKQQGHDIALACQPGSDIMERARKAGLAIEPIRMRQDYDVPAAWALSKIMKRRGTEILHAHHSTAHAIGLIASLFGGFPAFVVTRRVTFRIRTNPFSRIKYRSSRISAYVAVAESVQEELVKSGLSPERIEVIPSVIEAKTTSREEGLALRKELGMALDAPLIGTIANYSTFKGHEFLVEAAALVLKKIPAAQFLLVGRDTEKLAPLAERLGISKSVFLPGFRADAPRVLAALDLFVLPSLQEAAATAMREAMYAGLPCIGTSVGGIPETLDHGTLGLLVQPSDADALADAILQMIEHPDQERELARLGQISSAARFSIASALAKTEALYQRLLARPHA